VFGKIIQNRFMALLVCGVIALPVSAYAADKTLYYWSSYDADLYFFLENPEPETEARFEATLQHIFTESDKANRKIAPGLLAEYGFLLYQRGEFDAAVGYFERERDEWPESSAFMTKMIAQAEQVASE